MSLLRIPRITQSCWKLSPSHTAFPLVRAALWRIEEGPWWQLRTASNQRGCGGDNPTWPSTCNHEAIREGWEEIPLPVPRATATSWAPQVWCPCTPLQSQPRCPSLLLVLNLASRTDLGPSLPGPWGRVIAFGSSPLTLWFILSLSLQSHLTRLLFPWT